MSNTAISTNGAATAAAETQNLTPAGLFHDHPITEAQVVAAAETLYAETYGDLANLRDGTTYVLHLYCDGDSAVKLEDRMMETRQGELFSGPVISHRAELPEWADGSAVAQECMDENCKAEFIAEWESKIREALDPFGNGEED